MSEPGRNPWTAPGPLPRARFRAWLVSGPVGRLVGFLLDFARELWRLARR